MPLPLFLALPAGVVQNPFVHGVVAHRDAKDLVALWKPNIFRTAEGDVMLPSSTSLMKRHTTACIVLEADPERLAFVACTATPSAERTSLLLFRRTAEGEHELLHALWKHTEPTTQKRLLYSLAEWHGATFPGTHLSASFLFTEDRYLWNRMRHP